MVTQQYLKQVFVQTLRTFLWMVPPCMCELFKGL